jgi:hypothetical protein
MIPQVVMAHHVVAAQVEFESKVESSITRFRFQRLAPDGFNVGFIGSFQPAPPYHVTPEGKPPNIVQLTKCMM